MVVAMESTLPASRIWDVELDPTQNVTDIEPSLAGIGFENDDPFAWTGIGGSMELTLEDSMWWNAMQLRLAHAGLRDIDMEANLMVEESQGLVPPMVSAMPSTHRKNWPLKDDWIRARPMIKRLYFDEDKTLEVVMAAVEEEYGFTATPKMYKDRIRKWGLVKNKNEREMAALLRKKGQRDAIGKQSVLKVRDQVVAFEKIQDYFRRKRIPLETVSARHAGTSTPPSISCTTPPLSPRFTVGVPRSPLTPLSLAVPEQLLFNIDRYISVSFSSGTWIAKEDGACINLNSSGSQLDINDFHDYCMVSMDFFAKNKFVEGRRMLSNACGLLQSIIQTENPHTTQYLLRTFLRLRNQNFREVASQLSGYVSRMARVLLSTEHPWGQICQLMGSIDPNCSDETMIQCWKCMNKVFVQHLGQLHPIRLNSELDLISCCSRVDDLALTEQRLQGILVQCREVHGFSSRASLDVMDALWGNLYDQGKYAEAESLACQFLSSAREMGRQMSEVSGLDHVAITQYQLGKLDLAEMNIAEGVKMNSRHFEDSDAWALLMMVRLQLVLQHFGLGQRAAELGLEIERRLLQNFDDEV